MNSILAEELARERVAALRTEAVAQRRARAARRSRQISRPAARRTRRTAVASLVSHPVATVHAWLSAGRM